MRSASYCPTRLRRLLKSCSRNTPYRCYGVHRLHYLIIEYYQIDKDKPDEPLQYVQIQKRLPTQQIYQHSTQTEQKKDKYEEKEFYAHGT